MMTHTLRILLLSVGLSLVVGCSNSGDSSDDQNTGNQNPDNVDVVCNGTGDNSGVLATIGSQARESDPIALDIQSLEMAIASLPGACAQAQPLTVTPGDSVSDLLQVANSGG